MSGRWNRSRLLPDLLPILVVEGRVLLPGVSMVVHVKDPKGVKLVEAKVWNEDSWNGKYLGIIPQTKDDKLHHCGTAAAVIRAVARSHPFPHYVLLVVGLCRFHVNEIKQELPYIIAAITQKDYKQDPLSQEVKALADAFRELATELIELLDINNSSVMKLKHHLSSVSDERLPDVFTSLVKSSFEEKLGLLDAVSLSDRFKVAHPLLQRQIETLKLLGKASNTTLDPIAKEQIPHTKHRMASHRELAGLDDQDGAEDEIVELEHRLQAASLPEHALKAAQKELKRLKALPPQFPEHAVCRNYLDTILDLPWSKSTTDQLSIAQARDFLHSEHYGLDKLKKRVVEYLAVRQLKNDLKGPILCFVGAPGVGKTSVGRSIAKTLGRRFHRISLGGTCDQSDIRGHRRTYIGSMPGRIIQGLKSVGTNNPVFLLDEVDKLHTSHQGDPAAALLEVLDPEQNHTFTDHYLGIPFDLSQVMFLATANTMATIPPALLDRMEVIEVPGYTEEEKVQIALKHLLPKQLEQHGLTTGQLQIPPETMLEIAAGYTREAGVRCLDREIAGLCRAVAVKIAESKQLQTPGVKQPITITPDMLKDMMGERKYEHEVSERLNRPGVAVGLAWTANGGEIMFVEATRMNGRGKLVLTGQLGDVMKESALIALNWLRSNAAVYGIVCDQPGTTDVHVHFPAGAVGKDGPSAGVTIVTVLASLFSGRCTRSDTAMTGEVTLRGLVLPVGGIKEKVLAAHRAGIKHVILPRRNQKDLAELPEGPKNALKFTWVSSLEEVLLNAFDGGLKPLCKL